MKKTSIFMAALCCGLLTSCGGLGTTGTTSNNASTTQSNAANSGGGLLSGIMGGAGNSSTTSAIGNIISFFAGDILTNKNFLVGTWNYTKPCVQFESANLLAKAGGAVMAGTVENKVNEYYQKVGIKPGACSFTFNSDNTMSYTIAGRSSTGKYSFDSSKKTLTITTKLGQKITSYVSISGNTMGLTFDVSKLLTLVQAASSASSQLSTISSIAGNYNGMKLGFEFSRK